MTILANLRDIISKIPNRIQASGYLLQSADIWINLDFDLQKAFWDFVGEVTILNSLES